MSTLPADLQAAIETGTPAAVLTAAMAHFGCQAGTIHVLNANGQLSLAEAQGIPPQVAQVVQTVPIGKGIAGLAAERLEPVTICNLQTDTSGQAKPGARATGLEGTVAVPVRTATGELRGVLGIGKASAHDWTAEETSLLLALGQAATATKIL